ncbi:MAG: biotin transporter BioY [Hyphomonas sp.]|uniref:biotin transporter BioY n=1 Tax=Hyphomonas sp. TaxID=87 RepID=UPI003002D35B
MKHAAPRAFAHPALRPLVIGALGVAALTASSWISVPMYPVPMTLQTMTVLLLGALFGPRMGAAMVLSWLALSFTGAPVLADGKSGLLAFAGPTAGYLAAFPIAAFLAGYLPKGDRIGAHGLRLAGFLGLHGLVLALGAAWLSGFVGAETAVVAGVVPFLIGSVLKSGLATGLYAAWKGADKAGRAQ